jgi:hypothetical protein
MHKFGLHLHAFTTLMIVKLRLNDIDFKLGILCLIIDNQNMLVFYKSVTSNIDRMITDILTA